MLSYNIVDWLDAPGPRVAHDRDGSLIDELCSELHEKPTPAVRRSLRTILRTLGRTRTKQLAAQAVAIHEGGGMSVNDGSRWRTRGGVFFRMARRECKLACFGWRVERFRFARSQFW